MGCSSSVPSSLSDPNRLVKFESKRFETPITVIEKEYGVSYFQLKVLPYNNEFERVLNINIEAQVYSFSRLPPINLAIKDVFSYSLSFDDPEDKIYFRVVDESNNQVYLMKTINFDNYESYRFKTSLYEVYLMDRLKSLKDCVLTLQSYYITDFGPNRKKNLVLLFENADFTLVDLINYKRDQLKQLWTEKELLYYIKDMSNTLGRLENLGICHRDLRLENFWMCAKENKLKLACFGNARLYQLQGIESYDNMINTIRGKPLMMSPEVYSIYSSQVAKTAVFNPMLNDVYSLGKCFFLMKVGSSNNNLFTEISRMSNYDETLSTEIIAKMVNEYVKRRIYFKDVCFMIPDESTQKPPDNRLLEDILRKNYENLNIGLKLIIIPEKMAHTYVELLQTKDAVLKFDDLLTFFENNNDLENKANTLREIAELSGLLGNEFNAVEYYKESFGLFKEMASEARKNSNYSKSVELYVKTLNIGGLLFLKTDPNYLSIMENLGNVLRLDGKLEEAKKIQEKTLSQYITQKGENSIEVARLLNNLANTYAASKNYKTAVDLLQKGISIIRTNHAKDHANLLAMSLCNLGEIFRHNNQLKEAKIVIEEAIIIKEKLFGKESLIELASSLDNLGNVYYDLNEFSKAKKLYEDALVIKEGALNEYNCDIAISLNNLGNANRCLKILPAAEGCYQKALTIYKASSNEKHPNYGATLGNLGLVLKDQGKKKEALRYLEEATSILKKNLEHNSNDIRDYQFFFKEYEKLK